MSAASFSLARRMTEKNEPDMLRKYQRRLVPRLNLFQPTFLHVLIGIFFYRIQRKTLCKVSRDPSPCDWYIQVPTMHCYSLFFSIHIITNISVSEGNYSEKLCQQLVKKVTPTSPLPTECQKYPNVLKSLKRRDSNKSDHAKAFQGMSPHEMSAAMAARERGHEHHAQIQRRLTTSHRR